MLTYISWSSIIPHISDTFMALNWAETVYALILYVSMIYISWSVIRANPISLNTVLWPCIMLGEMVHLDNFIDLVTNLYFTVSDIEDGEYQIYFIECVENIGNFLSL